MTERPEGATPEYESEVAGYRQPMVTSIGIILGFQLTLLANWAFNAPMTPAIAGLGDTVLALTFLVSITLFVIVLHRLLDNRIRAEAGRRYQATLRIYLAALALAISGLVVALFV